jgi:hypothetical protein
MPELKNCTLTPLLYKGIPDANETLALFFLIDERVGMAWEDVSLYQPFNFLQVGQCLFMTNYFFKQWQFGAFSILY